MSLSLSLPLCSSLFSLRFFYLISLLFCFFSFLSLFDHFRLNVSNKGWQPGIQVGAADWDEDWDKFEEEGMPEEFILGI